MAVVTNDICAYLIGSNFGKHRIGRLCPNKTWEGFAGGIVGTFAMAYFSADFLSRI